EELTTLVNAIYAAYKEKVLDREKADRAGRLTWISARLREYQNQLKAKKDEQRDLMGRSKAADAGRTEQMQAFLKTQLARDEHELLETLASLRRNRAELTVLQGVLKSQATIPVPDAEVRAELAADPDVRAAQARVDRTRDRIENAAAASK